MNQMVHCSDASCSKARRCCRSAPTYLLGRNTRLFRTSPRSGNICEYYWPRHKQMFAASVRLAMQLRYAPKADRLAGRILHPYGEAQEVHPELFAPQPTATATFEIAADYPYTVPIRPTPMQVIDYVENTLAPQPIGIDFARLREAMEAERNPDREEPF